MNIFRKIFYKSSSIEIFLKEKILKQNQIIDRFTLQQFKLIFIKEGFIEVEKAILH